jgi:hypothetical protein
VLVLVGLAVSGRTPRLSGIDGTDEDMTELSVPAGHRG